VETESQTTERLSTWEVQQLREDYRFALWRIQQQLDAIWCLSLALVLAGVGVLVGLLCSPEAGFWINVMGLILALVTYAGVRYLDASHTRKE